MVNCKIVLDMSWLSWHIWKKMSFFQLQINQRKKTEQKIGFKNGFFRVKNFHFAKSHLSFFFSNLGATIDIFLDSKIILNVNMTWFFFRNDLLVSNLGSFSVMKLRSFFRRFLWRKRFEAIYWSHLLSWFGCQAFVSKPQEFGSHVILRDFPKTIRRE